MREYRIAVVVDASFGEKLAALSQLMPVWICKSEINTPAIERMWSINKASGLGHGITAFNRDEKDIAPEALLCGYLDTIDLHHGEFSHNPPWTHLEIYGAVPTSKMQELFGRFGVIKCTEITGGFVVQRMMPD